MTVDRSVPTSHGVPFVDQIESTHRLVRPGRPSGSAPTIALSVPMPASWADELDRVAAPLRRVVGRATAFG